MSRKVRIVGWGDSTTAGTPGFLSPVESPPIGKGNVRSQYAYWMMESHQGWQVLNKGVNGERTDEILSRFGRDVAAERPDVTIVLAGVNDIYQGRPNVGIEKNLEAMYELARGVGSTPVACSVLPYNTMTIDRATARRDLNGWIQRASTRMGIPFVDTASAVSRTDNPDLLAGSPDGLHPDVDGYRKMAGALSLGVARAMSRSLAP